MIFRKTQESIATTPRSVWKLVFKTLDYIAVCSQSVSHVWWWKKPETWVDMGRMVRKMGANVCAVCLLGFMGFKNEQFGKSSSGVYENYHGQGSWGEISVGQEQETLGRVIHNFSLVWLKGKPTANHTLTTLPHRIKSGVEADVFPLEQRIRGVSQRRFRGKYVLQWFGGTISLFILTWIYHCGLWLF